MSVPRNLSDSSGGTPRGARPKPRSLKRWAARVLLGAALSALPAGAARASASPAIDADALTLTATPAQIAQAASDAAPGDARQQQQKKDAEAPKAYVGPRYLDDAGEGPGLIVHGFAEFSFKTAYITPRGLVVETNGLVFQPLGGLVFPLYQGEGTLNSVTFIAGLWNSINSNQNQKDVGPWNEIDFFATLDFKLAKRVDLSVTYVPFISPPNLFKTEHNIETKLGFDDTDYLGTFALHPYVKWFYSVKGDSTVLLGKRGGTYDFEVGVDPSFTYKGIPRYPITVDFPTFVTVGPKSFWGSGDNSNFGTFSTGATATVPLAFVPKRWGNWHADVGFTYYHLINDNLIAAERILGNGGDRDRFVGTVGIGVGF